MARRSKQLQASGSPGILDLRDLCFEVFEGGLNLLDLLLGGAFLEFERDNMPKARLLTD